MAAAESGTPEHRYALALELHMLLRKAEKLAAQVRHASGGRLAIVAVFPDPQSAHGAQIADWPVAHVAADEARITDARLASAAAELGMTAEQFTGTWPSLRGLGWNRGSLLMPPERDSGLAANIPVNMQRERKRRRLTQGDFGRKVFVSAATVCAIEKGDRQPTPDGLREIAVALGVSPASLIAAPQGAPPLPRRAPVRHTQVRRGVFRVS